MQFSKKKKRKTRIWTILSVILGVIVLGLGATMLAFEPGRREALSLTISEMEFHKLRDGIYLGEYKGTKDSLRNTKVQVTVASGKVTEIQVVEGALANEKQRTEVGNGLSINDLLDRVIESQSLQVDIISGATITSKVHLKAMENALEQAKHK